MATRDLRPLSRELLPIVTMCARATASRGPVVQAGSSVRWRSLMATVLLLLLALVPAGANDLDPSFGVDGVASFDLMLGDIELTAAALAPDGTIVFAIKGLPSDPSPAPSMICSVNVTGTSLTCPLVEPLVPDNRINGIVCSDAGGCTAAGTTEDANPQLFWIDFTLAGVVSGQFATGFYTGSEVETARFVYHDPDDPARRYLLGEGPGSGGDQAFTASTVNDVSARGVTLDQVFVNIGTQGSNVTLADSEGAYFLEDGVSDYGFSAYGVGCAIKSPPPEPGEQVNWLCKLTREGFLMGPDPTFGQSSPTDGITATAGGGCMKWAKDCEVQHVCEAEGLVFIVEDCSTSPLAYDTRVRVFSGSTGEYLPGKTVEFSRAATTIAGLRCEFEGDTFVAVPISATPGGSGATLEPVLYSLTLAEEGDWLGSPERLDPQPFSFQELSVDEQLRLILPAATPPSPSRGANGSLPVLAGRSGTDPAAAVAFARLSERLANPLIFVDGFELGDASAWSATLP